MFAGVNMFLFCPEPLGEGENKLCEGPKIT